MLTELLVLYHQGALTGSDLAYMASLNCSTPTQSSILSGMSTEAVFAADDTFVSLVAYK